MVMMMVVAVVVVIMKVVLRTMPIMPSAAMLGSLLFQTKPNRENNNNKSRKLASLFLNGT